MGCGQPVVSSSVLPSIANGRKTYPLRREKETSLGSLSKKEAYEVDLWREMQAPGKTGIFKGQPKISNSSAVDLYTDEGIASADMKLSTCLDIISAFVELCTHKVYCQFIYSHHFSSSLEVGAGCRELERRELERRELERRELERRELERRELERGELERREVESRKLERRELKRRELEGRDVTRT
ncbi:hypothetical protein FHG87_011602 [Trinorchestia longiramus]|nr:hypothetical protein FHG87_011602 [Trinorchestia longiramus]